MAQLEPGLRGHLVSEARDAANPPTGRGTVPAAKNSSEVEKPQGEVVEIKRLVHAAVLHKPKLFCIVFGACNLGP